MSSATNYKAIDIMKYICSILVIMVHTTPLLPWSHDANWFLMTLLGRFVVPFYFISSGYFIFKNIDQKPNNYFKKYILSLLKIYLIWSIIYIPLGIQFIHTTFNIPVILYPIALLVALFYIGTYFHLWYIPALIFSLILVYYASKYIPKKYLILLSFILLIIGSFETYYGFLFTPLKNIFDIYIRIFFTTRNGLFFGLFYVVLGYFVAQSNTIDRWIPYPKLFAFITFFIMIIEAFLIHDSNNLDSNILLAAAPFTLCLFIACKNSSIQWNLPYKKLREYTSLYYFTHAYFLILIPLGLQIFHKQAWYHDHGIFRFIIVLFCTHMISYLIYSIQQYKLKKLH